MKAEVLKRTGGKFVQDMHIDLRPQRVNHAVLLLPVYLCSYSYRQKSRAVAVTGNNGNVEGEKPPWGSGVLGQMWQYAYEKTTQLVHDNF